MAAVEIDFVGNITTGKTIVSKDNPTPVDVSLTYGDTARLRVQLVKAAATGLGRVSVIPATGLSCQIGLASARGASSVTSATALDPADSTDTWTVDLPLNIAGVGALATATGATVFIEALIGLQRFSFPVRLYSQILTGSTQDPPVEDTALGELKAAALYVPKNGLVGDFQLFRTPSGSIVKFYVGDDLEPHWELVS